MAASHVYEMIRARFLITRALFIFTVLTSVGCMMVGMGVRPHDRAGQTSDEWIREELTFGSDIPGGGSVTELDWQNFLADIITPRFPQGFSVSSGYGQYRMRNGELVKEKNWVVVIYLAPGTPELAIHEIIQAYKKRFKQESVMRATSTARVRFDD
ncbi:MAG TPA: DUF3574 domain-containing protein [Bacteroidota bacterium]|nr:DUF3574 domain-containing protein [Bacteroidota bacterium]